jgi:hypothetical protein
MPQDLQIEAGDVFQSLSIKEKEGKRFVFDPIRKDWFILTKEEWVRQIFIGVLSRYFSPAHIAIEKKIKLSHVEKRFDLVVMNKDLTPLLLAEFKNPEVELNEAVFRQIALYNSRLSAPYLLISNGIIHYLCNVDTQNGDIQFLNAFPFRERS